MKKYFSLFGFFTLFCFAPACAKSDGRTVDNSTVETVDLKRYMGKWYEIARLDNRFEKGLVGVTAEYTLMEDGKVQVLNSGHKGGLNGKYKQAKGKARRAHESEQGHLEVSFFLWFYADYFIIELDQENYSYAMIGGTGGKYLWLLSRTPQLPQVTINMLVEKATQRGYDTSKLLWVEQQTN